MSKLCGHPSPIHPSQAESIFSTAIYWLLDQDQPPSAQRLSEFVSTMRSPSKTYNADETPDETSSDSCTQCILPDWWGFLVIESDMTVGFTCPVYRQYFSVKKEFVCGEMSARMNPDEEIAKRCLHHISQHAPHHLFQESPKCSVQNCPNCSYPRCAECEFSFIHWRKHYLAAESESSSLPLMMHEMLREHFCRQHSHRNDECKQLSPNDLNKALQVTVRFDMEIITRTYLEMGADPNSCSSPSKATALHIAAAANVSRHMIRLLLERGADVEALDSEGRSPLHIAANSGAVSCALLLIEFGANMNSKTANWYDSTSYGQCLLEAHPWECEYPPISDIYAPSTWSDGRWMTAALASEVDWWVIDRLLCLPDGKHPPAQPMDPLNHSISGLTPLHVAASSSQYFVIAALIANGADVHEKTTEPNELTALDIAVNMRNDGVAALLKCCSIFRPQLPWVNPFLDHFAVQDRSNENPRQQHLTATQANSWTAERSTKKLCRGDISKPYRFKKSRRKVLLFSQENASLQNSSEEIPCPHCSQINQNKAQSVNLKDNSQAMESRRIEQARGDDMDLFQTPPPSRHTRESERTV